MNDDEKKRFRAMEDFISEMRGGRRLLGWLISAVGGGAAIVGVIWDKIFGS